MVPNYANNKHSEERSFFFSDGRYETAERVGSEHNRTREKKNGMPRKSSKQKLIDKINLFSTC